MYNIHESGLPDTFEEAALKVAYDFFGDKSFVFNASTVEDYMVLDEMKIALGPYLIAIIMAFFALIKEVLTGSNEFNSEEKNRNIKRQDSVDITEFDHGRKARIQSLVSISERNRFKPRLTGFETINYLHDTFDIPIGDSIIKCPLYKEPRRRNNLAI
jgi:hypothetical protein